MLLAATLQFKKEDEACRAAIVAPLLSSMLGSGARSGRGSRLQRVHFERSPDRARGAAAAEEKEHHPKTTGQGAQQAALLSKQPNVSGTLLA